VSACMNACCSGRVVGPAESAAILFTACS
jgi:hypothetical protein